MEPTMQNIRAPADFPIKITKWKVRKGFRVSHGSLLCIYESKEGKNQKLKSNEVGTIADIHVKEGEEATAGSLLIQVQACTHPTVMKDMCAECGANLRDEQGRAGERNKPTAASVAMVHSIPELIVSESEALELGRADENRLLKTRKLVLLVDLDQTLIHTTNDNIPANLKDVYHFQQYSHGNLLLWYHTRLRPRTQQFLEKISKLYELHICTFGARLYAHTIAKFLDPDGKYFSHRILSRDECFNQSSKTANLKALFPCGDSMVCIIDDREDVWNFSPNLIHVKPYRFFQGTADINAPIGLAKTENDDQPITHKVRKVSRSNSKVDVETTESEKSNDSDLKEASTSEADQMETDLAEDAKNNNKNKQDQSEPQTETPNDQSKDNTVSQSETKTENTSEKSNENTDHQSDTMIENGSQISESSTISQSESRTEEISCQPIENKDEQSDLDPAESPNKDDESELEPVKKEVNTESKSDEKSENKTPDEEKDEGKDCVDAEEEIEWDDEDDYLLHLEEILTRIHKAFYDLYDQMKSKSGTAVIKKPDLKNIIPYVKRKVLKGTNIVFSGVYPTNVPQEKSHAYLVAKALGANIQNGFIPKTDGQSQDATTHVVAARLGTTKVRMAEKAKNVKIVNPDWLWCCAERWEKVEERLFPLTKDPSPMSMRDSPVIVQNKSKSEKRKLDQTEDLLYDRASGGKRVRTNNADNQSEPDDSATKSASQDTQSENNADNPNNELKSSKRESRFSVSYNPLYSFSDDDIACMDKEVEEIMDEDGDESDEDEEERNSRIRSTVLNISSGDDDSSSDASMTGDSPRGWTVKGNKTRSYDSSSSDRDEKEVKDLQEESENELECFEKTMDAFAPDTESDADSIGSVDDELADAVEKEFLAQI